MKDTYYATEVHAGDNSWIDSLSVIRLKRLVKSFEPMFKTVPEGYRFGTVAVRDGNFGFVTTSRGKKELGAVVKVASVDHSRNIVHILSDEAKATLNAPLLSYIFDKLPQCSVIIHYHEKMAGLQTLPYAPPGTCRDSKRNIRGSFNIEGHGCFCLFDFNMNAIHWE